MGDVSVIESSKPRRDLAKFGDFGGKFIRLERSSPGRFSKILFGGGFLADVLQVFRYRRERGSDRHRGGFPRVASWDAGRCLQGLSSMDSGDG